MQTASFELLAALSLPTIRYSNSYFFGGVSLCLRSRAQLDPDAPCILWVLMYKMLEGYDRVHHRPFDVQKVWTSKGGHSAQMLCFVLVGHI